MMQQQRQPGQSGRSLNAKLNKKIHEHTGSRPLIAKLVEHTLEQTDTKPRRLLNRTTTDPPKYKTN